MFKLNSKKKELSEKYKIDFNKLEKEQIKLAKSLEIKDKIDISLIDKFGAMNTIFLKNTLICCFIVCDKNFEIIDRAYVSEKVKFPYFPGFRSYRELPSMISVFEKLNEKPDLVFISGLGIAHPRLGLASHFGLVTGVPTIGISNSLIGCTVKGEKIEDGNDILRDDKKVGKVLISKKGSNPMFVSPGNHISIDNSYKISKSLILIPHKRPEPLHLASKYSKEVMKELRA